MLALTYKVLGISANMLIGIDEKVVENEDNTAERKIKNNMIAEPLVLEFGVGLIPFIMEGLDTDYVNKKRISLVKKNRKVNACFM